MKRGLTIKFEKEIARQCPKNSCAFWRKSNDGEVGKIISILLS